MANPYRGVANMSKNPWRLDGTFTKRSEAYTSAEKLKAAGHKVRVTRYKYGKHGDPSFSYNVWITETEAAHG